MDIIEKLREMQQMIDNETQIIVVSPIFAKRIVNANIDCHTILFQLNSYMNENEAFVLQGELRTSMLKNHREKLIKLYTLKELKEQIFTEELNENKDLGDKSI